MNWLNTIAILLIAFLAVFLESYFRGLRNLVGAQIDLLPALMVYASLSAGISTVALLATLGGLWFDSLSANPLGITVLPLLVIGLIIHSGRDLILREQRYAQFMLGLAASATAPLFTVLALLGLGAEPGRNPGRKKPTEREDPHDREIQEDESLAGAGNHIVHRPWTGHAYRRAARTRAHKRR